MVEIVAALLLWQGALFILLASIGVLRFQDVYLRMHAATKTGTVGISSIVLGLAIHFGQFGVTVAAILIIAFFLVTAPIAAHVIGRAAYLRNVPKSPATRVDEVRDFENTIDAETIE